MDGADSKNVKGHCKSEQFEKIQGFDKIGIGGNCGFLCTYSGSFYLDGVWMMSDYSSNFYHNNSLICDVYFTFGMPYTVLGIGLTVIVYQLVNIVPATTFPTKLKAIIVTALTGLFLTIFVSLTLFLGYLLIMVATG